MKRLLKFRIRFFPIYEPSRSSQISIKGSLWSGKVDWMHASAGEVVKDAPPQVYVEDAFKDTAFFLLFPLISIIKMLHRDCDHNAKGV